MAVFVDTSAWYALTSASDREHVAAVRTYRDLVERDEVLVTTSYVLAETMALIQRRLGLEPLTRFAAAAKTVEVIWIDSEYHALAENLLFERRRRRLNIVDAASMVAMRERGIKVAFAFDPSFRHEGFRLLGAAGR
ncbi:MAG: DNA-binding protein [Gemmatimonadales bacterium]|nr:23S rRNA-specific endonuclease VapC20 [bacterium HR33]GIW53025.1 MAG: DNA-binding protein [Gemmatimonadales bacterium]